MTKQIEIAFLKARNAEKRGDVTQAVQLYRAILAAAPRHARAAAALERLAGVSQPVAAVVRAGEVHAGEVPQEVLDRLLAFERHEQVDPLLREGVPLLAAYPQSAILHGVIGAALIRGERPAEAVACFRRAVALAPDVAELHCGLGDALSANGEREAALASFERACELAPAVARNFNKAAFVLRDLDRYNDAIAWHERAIAIDPGDVEAHVAIGTILARLRLHKPAIFSFERALAARPGFAPAIARKVMQQMLIHDWRAVDEVGSQIETLGIEGGALASLVITTLDDNAARQRKRAENYAAANFPAIATPAFTPPARRPERLKIGYFSADFGTHPVMYLLTGLMRLHDRERFDIHAFSFNGTAPNPERERLAAQVDRFHEITAESDAKVVSHARDLGIDIAVDLMGATRGSRTALFQRRLAPVQVNYLGYPGTMGADYYDYMIADRVTVPEATRAHYSERLILMPYSYMPCDNARPIAAAATTRADHGLPGQGVVFCCFNNSYKITPAEFDIWCRLLLKVEGSVLWMRRNGDDAEAALRDHALDRGVDPARLVYARRVAGIDEHLARFRHADLFLDTFAYNAHSTANDALWAGLPVLTMAGESFAARVAASLNAAIGLPDLIVNSPGEYEALALALAQDPQRLAAIRARLAHNRLTMPLFDSERHTRHLEAGYDAAYARFLAGQPPADITVPA